MIFPLNMVIFHSYVSLPEGRWFSHPKTKRSSIAMVVYWRVEWAKMAKGAWNEDDSTLEINLKEIEASTYETATGTSSHHLQQCRKLQIHFNLKLFLDQMNQLSFKSQGCAPHEPPAPPRVIFITLPFGWSHICILGGHTYIYIIYTYIYIYSHLNAS